MMRKTLAFLIISLIFVFGSCTRMLEEMTEESDELLLLTRSFDEKPIIEPNGILRLKEMLQKALYITNDSMLTAIFTDPNRVEYAVITGQENKFVMHMRPVGDQPQCTVDISDQYLNLTYNGALFVVIHELCHLYSHIRNERFGNDVDHAVMVSDLMYRNWVGAALGIPKYSYVIYYLIYSFTYESPVYARLSDGERSKVETICKDYGLPE